MLRAKKRGKALPFRGIHACEISFRQAVDLDDYLRSIPILDKAGGYAAQEDRGRLIECIEGSISNVIGLPMERVLAALNEYFEEAGVSGGQSCQGEAALGKAALPVRLFPLRRSIFETGDMLEKGQGDRSNRTVSLLGDHELRLALDLFLLLLIIRVIFLAPQKPDQIGVLLDGARLAQIAQPWPPLLSPVRASGLRLS